MTCFNEFCQFIVWRIVKYHFHEAVQSESEGSWLINLAFNPRSVARARLQHVACTVYIMLIIEIQPYLLLFPIDLEHTGNNFTGRSSIELPTVYLRALAALKWTYMGNYKCVRKTTINLFFWNREALDLFLDSVRSPMNLPWLGNKHYHRE